MAVIAGTYYELIPGKEGGIIVEDLYTESKSKFASIRQTNTLVISTDNALDFWIAIRV
ncbi:hypothetical protein RINTHH_18380 [Richelia intracellularis HH01]|jgi:hypothetical protein|uniref:Uncharacterized protein n=1 Tax=Richelia intracellularis HH01 TaxID=1165094 RepID=M1X184_9NOST|nr:hypothetical protein [Richelia intracellularis]CCH67993.1 hypothetical protein RINTHH_18380 [Richelia intracellularis HH01]